MQRCNSDNVEVEKKVMSGHGNYKNVCLQNLPAIVAKIHILSFMLQQCQTHVFFSLINEIFLLMNQILFGAVRILKGEI